MSDMEIDLFEEEYCQTRAVHKAWTLRECYEQASLATDYKREATDAAIKKRITRLEQSEKIRARIEEIREELRRKQSAKWEGRKEEVGELMFKGVMSAPMTLKNGIHDAVRTVGMLADLYGWRAADKVELTSTTHGIDTASVNGKIDTLMQKLGVKVEKGGSDEAQAES